MKTSEARHPPRGQSSPASAAIGGLVFTRYPKDLPPTYGNLLRMGDTLTYAAQRTLLPRQSLVREYDVSGHHVVSRRLARPNPGKTEKRLGGRIAQLQTGSFR